MASRYDCNGKMCFYAARVGLAAFRLEDIKVDEREWPEGDFTTTPFALCAEGGCLYCPVLREGGVYIAKINPASLEAVSALGPLP